MTYEEWFLDIAENMNDAEPGHEFTRYTRKEMIRAFNDAMCLVAKYRSDLFTEYQKVKLTPGKYQDARGCCTNILEILDQLDENGNVVRDIKNSRTNTERRKTVWKKPSCLIQTPESGYLVENAWIDANMNGRFTVDPPLPCDVDAWVLVKCVKMPSPLRYSLLNSSVNVSCIHMVAAKHYVLAWLLSGDRFANGANPQASEQYQLFFNILGVIQRQEDRLESAEQA